MGELWRFAEGELMAHTCHARNCTRAVPPKMLMCRQHWFTVPRPLRDAVWATYRPGQEVDKDPSPEWIEAADAAIDAVAEREGSVTFGAHAPNRWGTKA